MTAAVTRYIAVVLAALALAWAGVAYRSHLIDLGHAAGVSETTATYEEARRLAAKAADLSTEASRVRFAQTQDNLKAQHENVVRNLRLALADSDHRNQLLSARLAGLLDQAAGVLPGSPGAPGASGGQAPAAEGNSTVAALIETAAENYAICRANAVQLVELQDWYRDLRESRTPPGQ